MRTSLLNKKLNILEVVSVQDSSGQVVNTWGVLTANVPCRMTEAPKNFSVEDKNYKVTKETFIFFLYEQFAGQITNNNRIQYEGKEYAIVKVSAFQGNTTKNSHIECYAQLVNIGGQAGLQSFVNVDHYVLDSRTINGHALVSDIVLTPADIGLGDISDRVESLEAEVISLNSDIATINTTLTGKEDVANKGIANGYASLDGSGKVPSAQLPSFVDDILEYPNFVSFPATGVSGVIYVSLATNLIYRWSGSSYIEVSSTSLSLGTTVGSATQGGIFFAGAGGVIAQDTTNLVWDNTNKRLSIGSYSDGTTAPPLVPLHIVGSGTVSNVITAVSTQLRLAVSGIAGISWPLSADFRLGKYAAGINSQTQLDIRLGNGATPTPDTTVMTLLANGNVGIGLTNPGAMLDVNGTSYFRGNLYTNNIIHYSGGAVPLNLGNILYVRNDSGKVGIGVDAPASKLSIQTAIDVSQSPFQVLGIYWNGTAWVTGQAVMKISDQTTGYRVGFGIDAPTERMHLYAGTGTIRSLVQSNTVVTQVVSSDITGKGYVGTYSAHSFVLRSNDTDRVTIDTSGNVGIAVPVPQSRLDVDGGMRIRSGLTNAATRPVVGAGIINGEINGQGDAVGSDSGFLRLSAGGQTTAIQKTFIDLSGYANGVADMLNAIVFGTSGVEQMRLQSSKLGLGVGSSIRAKFHLSGGETSGAFASASVALGYSTTGDYPHFIHTRHNAANSNNFIDFYVSDGTIGGVYPTNAVHVLTMASGGLVGIGNTAPQAKMHLGNASITTNSGVEFLIADNNPKIKLEEQDQAVDSRVWDILVDAGNFNIRSVNDLDTVATYTLSITRGGSVGIGASAPLAKLHVADTMGNAGLLLTGALNAVGLTSGIEFKYFGGVGTTNIARIMAYTQSGGGGDILFQTSSGGAAAYSTKVKVSRAGELVVGVSQNLLFADMTTYQKMQTYSSTPLVINPEGNMVQINNVALPTHQLTLGGTGLSTGGIALYNIADQITNFERAVIQWSSNIFVISTGSAGTGVVRGINIVSGSDMRITANDQLFLQNDSTDRTVEFHVGGTRNATHLQQATHNHSSGVVDMVTIRPSVSQTLTAGYRALQINVTETTVGSGIKRLIDIQKNSTSLVYVDNTGLITTTFTGQQLTFQTGGYSFYHTNGDTYMRAGFTNKYIQLRNSLNTVVQYTLPDTGAMAIGMATSPTALLHLGAGTATANTAPLQFTAGVVETVPRAGIVEFVNSETGLTFVAVNTRRAFVFDTATQTLSGKRIQKRAQTSTANTATYSVNTDNVDLVEITGQAVNITGFTITGTAVAGDTLVIALTGTGAGTVALGSSFEASSLPLPTTFSTARQDWAFRWNTVTSKWRFVGSV